MVVSLHPSPVTSTDPEIEIVQRVETPLAGAFPQGPVTRAMVHARTQQLAQLAGYPSPEVHQCHYEQAKRELTGETDRRRQNII